MSRGHPSFTRRRLLKNTAVAGVGALAAPTVASADADSKLATLKQLGVVQTEADVRRHADTSIPAEMRTGERLLARLSADGLLERASLDALPAFGASDDDAGRVHHVTENRQTEVAFTKPIPQGRLQVTFSEYGLPTATLFPDGGGPLVLYNSPDGSGYERVESDLTWGGRDDVSPDGCGSDCDGCACTNNWCWFDIKSTKCLNCQDDGDCVTTTTCGC